ncbi:MAG TPA: hypothetical protein VKW04_09880 [Planctomycetota bacterium]|nr:hypothetical protein [Planctomycetota bacterium]
MDPFKQTEELRAGLCASCRHLKKNRSDRGSIFYYCRRSESDPAFPKYPSLPVLRCRGHEPVSGSPTS